MPSHPKYGDASYTVFLIENMIFHVSNRLLKLSPFFRGVVEGIRTGLEDAGEGNDHPILLSGISIFEMTSFLDVTESRVVYLFLVACNTLTYDPGFEYRCLDGDPELKFIQWTAALHLATLWGFDYIGEKIIEQVDEMISAEDPLDRIDVSLKCRVEKWLHPAYVVLCKRETGLSDAEAERLGLRRSIAICRVRESLRSVPLPNRPTYHSPPPRQARRRGRYEDEYEDYERSHLPPGHVVPQAASSNVIQPDAIALELQPFSEHLAIPTFYASKRPSSIWPISSPFVHRFPSFKLS